MFLTFQLEKITGITFNTLILDCEGCHKDFINTYKHILAAGNVNKIIFGQFSSEVTPKK